MQEIYDLTLRVKRYNPEEKRSWMQEYRLNAGRTCGSRTFAQDQRRDRSHTGMELVLRSCPVRNLFGHRQWKTPPRLRASRGKRGRPVQDHHVHIEPHTVAPLVRDLIVDLGKAYARVESVKPYIIKPSENRNKGKEYQIPPQMLDKYVEATRCINCFCCATACIGSHKTSSAPTPSSQA